MRGRNSDANKRARQLRRHATNAETKLWFAIRDRRLAGFKFARQIPIGPYVADFVCREQMLIVEVDGGQHAESSRDQIRDTFLRKEVFHVLRFWNSDVLTNCDEVLNTILQALRTNPL